MYYVRIATTHTEAQVVNASDPLADCDEQITPACVRALYKYYYGPVAAEKNSIAIGILQHPAHTILDCTLTLV